MTSGNARHCQALESLRGIAALMVAVAHSLIVVRIAGVDNLWRAPFGSLVSADAMFARVFVALVDGQAAVTLFFVLSGVVLGLSLERDRGAFPATYARFVLRRAFRIYPAHLVVLAAVLCTLFSCSAVNPGNYPNASTFFNWYYRELPAPGTIARNVVLREIFLNPVTWTLQVELLASLALPFMSLVSRVRFGGLPLQMLLVAAFWGAGLLHPKSTILPFLYQFHLGLVIARMSSASAPPAGQGRAAWPAMLGITLFAMLLPKQWYPDSPLIQPLMAIGAGAVIRLAMRDPPRWLVECAALRSLGRCSYGFYLWHFPLLWFTTYFAYQGAVLRTVIVDHALAYILACGAGSIAGAYGLAVLTFRFVESPGIALGKLLCESLGRRGRAG